MPQFRHGKNTKVLVGAYDLSTMFREAQANATADTAETSTFGSSAKTYVVGMTDGRVTLGGCFSGGVGEVDEVLAAALGVEQPFAFTYAPEGLAAGRRVWGAQMLEASYGVQGGIGDIVAVNAELQSSGGLVSTPSLADIATAVTGTGLGTAQDTLKGTDTIGGYAVLHVPTFTGFTSVTIKIQHATTSGGSYTDLVTFTAVTGVVGEVVMIPKGTTINEFVKYNVSAVSGTGSFNMHAALYRLNS